MTIARCKQGLHELAGENMMPNGGCRACRHARERRERNLKAGRHPREVLIEVSNAPLRERFLELYLRGETNAVQTALQLGWTTVARGAVVGDCARVRRALGLAPDRAKDRDGKPLTYLRQTIKYEAARDLCLALAADPAAVGV